MRRFLLLITLLLSVFILHSQDYTIEGNSIKMEKIVENTNMDIETANGVLITYLSKIYNDLNTTLKSNTTNNIVVKGIYSDVTRFKMNAWWTNVYHQLVISIKDNRVRIVIETSKVQLQSSQTTEDRWITDFYPINPKASISYIYMSKAKSEEFINTTTSLMKNTIATIEDALRNHEAEEDW